MPPDLSGRRAEVEGGEERPEIFPSERRQGGGCCGFPNAKSEERAKPRPYNILGQVKRLADFRSQYERAGPRPYNILAQVKRLADFRSQ